MREAMQRLFPSINIQEKAHDQWVSKFSAAALKHIAELGNKQPLKQLPDEDQSAVIAELEKRNTQLSGMVTNYKRIIEDTVSTLLTALKAFFFCHLSLLCLMETLSFRRVC